MNPNGSGDETAADAERVFADLSGPDALQIYAYRRQDGHMKNGEERLSQTLGVWKVERDAAKAEIDHAGVRTGFSPQHCVGIRAGHRDTFRFARNRVKFRFRRCDRGQWLALSGS